MDGEDLQLEAVDQLYGLVGLRRYRRLWMVEDAGEVLGAALCYRGPLGFNFSFLENRCDLMMRPGLSAWQIRAVVESLLAAARGAYWQIGCGFIPIVVDRATAAAVHAIGATPVREYSQSIWLKPAFEAWYDHCRRPIRRAPRPSPTVMRSQSGSSYLMEDPREGDLSPVKRPAY